MARIDQSGKYTEQAVHWEGDRLAGMFVTVLTKSLVLTECLCRVTGSYILEI